MALTIKYRSLLRNLLCVDDNDSFFIPDHDKDENWATFTEDSDKDFHKPSSEDSDEGSVSSVSVCF